MAFQVSPLMLILWSKSVLGTFHPSTSAKFRSPVGSTSKLSVLLNVLKATLDQKPCLQICHNSDFKSLWSWPQKGLFLERLDVCIVRPKAARLLDE